MEGFGESMAAFTGARKLGFGLLGEYMKDNCWDCWAISYIGDPFVVDLELDSFVVDLGLANWYLDWLNIGWPNQLVVYFGDLDLDSFVIQLNNLPCWHHGECGRSGAMVSMIGRIRWGNGCMGTSG